MKSSIKDVARRAGVSIATVSHVINSTHYVSEEKRHRVLSAIEGLNYKPNKAARNLRSKQTDTALVVVDTEYARGNPTALNRLLQNLTDILEERMCGLSIRFDDPAEIVRLCREGGDWEYLLVVTNASRQYTNLLPEEGGIVLLDMDLLGIAGCPHWRENDRIAFCSRHYYGELANHMADSGGDSACYLLSMEQMGIMKELFLANVNYAGIFEQIKVIDAEVSAAYVALLELFEDGRYRNIYLAEYKFALGAVKLFLLKPELLHHSFTITYKGYDRPFESFGQPVAEHQFIPAKHHIEEAVQPLFRKGQVENG